MLNTILEYLGNLGLEPIFLVVFLLFSIVITWLYKQISNNMITHQNQVLLDFENTLTSYNTVYKSCIQYRDGTLPKEDMVNCLIDSIRYLEYNHFCEIEKSINSNQSMDTSIKNLREKILELKKSIDTYYPNHDLNKLSGKFQSKIYLFEKLFSPVVFTFFSFVFLLVLSFITVLFLLREFHIFIISLIILFNVAFLLALLIAIIDKRFKHNKKGYLMLVVYIILICLGIWLHNIFVLILTLICSLVYIGWSMKQLVK
ncbi:hypothetical protein FZC74_06875 [Sutcliffiella horikoshii]|uniref:Uncharacterized protein n=1 Tax=Sutcliffiella horikoshii TaxID=79883 RepID=A0AA94WPE8_9BACI|nr:hypothetical protein [Sutcliffiella horikoshii]TYS59873.1 hypothetical protein FZC74_06875 [Sutcliffiella horikoshii]